MALSYHPPQTVCCIVLCAFLYETDLWKTVVILFLQRVNQAFQKEDVTTPYKPSKQI